MTGTTLEFLELTYAFVDISATGTIELQYETIDEADPRNTGESATVGIENEGGTVGVPTDRLP